MTGWGLLLGAVFGLGAALVWYGLRPPTPALAVVLERWRRPPAPPSVGPRRHRLLAWPLARLGLPSTRARQDLAILDREVELYLAEVTIFTATGGLLAPLLAAAWGTGGLVPLWAALLGGLAGWRLAAARLHQPAQRRRDQLRHTLAVVQDLTAVGLAGGAGLDQALDEAVAVCSGWGADRLRRTLATARLTRTPTWQALHELGREIGISELEELAGAIRLTANEGTRVRASLSAHAAVMRGRATAAMEAAARAAGVRMSMPVLLLALGYGLWLMFPALSLMRAGLGG
jgi:tight adherence protein C